MTSTGGTTSTRRATEPTAAAATAAAVWLTELENRQAPHYLNLYQEHYSIYILNVSQTEESKQSVLL